MMRVLRCVIVVEMDVGRLERRLLARKVDANLSE